MREFQASNERRARAALVVAALLLLLPAVSYAAGDLILLPHVPPSKDLDLRMMIALIVLFVLLIAPVNQLIFKPLLQVLDEREARTAGTRARAARLEEEAREVLERYEREVAKTREETELQRRGSLERVRSESQELTGAARRAAEQHLEQARGELASAVTAARGGLRGGAEELAREAATRVLGRPL